MCSFHIYASLVNLYWNSSAHQQFQTLAASLNICRKASIKTSRNQVQIFLRGKRKLDFKGLTEERASISSPMVMHVPTL